MEDRPALYVVDRSGRVTAWTQRAEQMKGYPAAQAIGLAASTFYIPEDRANAVPERELIDAIEGQEMFEGWRVRRDGSRFRAAVRITPLYDGSGHVSGFVKLTREVLPSPDARARSASETRQLSETLRSVALHLKALHKVVEAPSAETPDRVVAKLTVLEWRLARLEETLREAVTAGAVE